MNDLIRKSKLLRNIDKAVVLSGKFDEILLQKKGAFEVIGQIRAAPAVDAVEVVRCKDCEHYQYGEFFTDIKFCCRLRGENGEVRRYSCSDEDYCSYGIRRSE